MIFHGYVYGYCNTQALGKVKRGRRILCNKRRSHKKGCGKTYSLYINCYTPKRCYTIDSLWSFLCAMVNKTPLAVLKNILAASFKTAYRIAKKLRFAQHRLRQMLTQITPQPDTLTSSDPLMKTYCHLKKAFPSSPNPLAALQYSWQKPIL